jgi:hypothetical protein
MKTDKNKLTEINTFHGYNNDGKPLFGVKYLLKNDQETGRLPRVTKIGPPQIIYFRGLIDPNDLNH